jgi:hypothetical protein
MITTLSTIEVPLALLFGLLRVFQAKASAVRVKAYFGAVAIGHGTSLRRMSAT